MGRETNGHGGEITIEQLTESGTNGNSSGGSSTATATSGSGGNGNGGSGNGGSGNGGSGNGGNTKPNTISESNELAVLTDEERTLYEKADPAEQKRLLRNARKRQRYAENKKAGGQEVKPRKVKGTNKKDETPALDVQSLNMIVSSLSAVVASRPNCEHWLLSEKEINSITVPLSKMLAESTMFANMGQYSNQIALCMACFTVFMPRLILTVQKQKEVKKIARTGQTTNTNVTDQRIGTAGKEKDSNLGTVRGNDKKPSSNGANDRSNEPFYGLPLC